jgi:hypothetical protein
MALAKSLAHCARAAILSVALAGCAYETTSTGWDGPYAANDVYDGPLYGDYHGPDFFIGGVDNDHWRGHRPFHYAGHGFHQGLAHSRGFGGFHSGGFHMAHAGGFGGHGRG